MLAKEHPCNYNPSHRGEGARITVRAVLHEIAQFVTAESAHADMEEPPTHTQGAVCRDSRVLLGALRTTSEAEAGASWPLLLR